MTVSRTIRNQAQTMKGRITEELGRVTATGDCNAGAGPTGSAEA
jgi:hypothetical protein